MNAGKVASEKHTSRILDSAIDKASRKEHAKLYSRYGAKSALQLSVIGVGAAKSIRNDRRNAQQMFIDRYRKRHPTTKLTDAEISSKMVF